MIVQLSEIQFPIGEAKAFCFSFADRQVAFGHTEYLLTDVGPITMSITGQGHSKYTISASFDGILHMPCARCLKDVPYRLTFPIEREVIVSAENMETDDPDEQLYLHGYELDTDILVRSELFLNIPIRVLCKEDCRGLCPRCGADLNQGRCGCEDVPSDPRMAAIRDIFRNSNMQG